MTITINNFNWTVSFVQSFDSIIETLGKEKQL